MIYKGIVRGKVIERVNLKEFINSDGFRHAIEEVLVERIKPECLAEQQR